VKTKIAFVVGLAIGYIFGTRAGRERYEQIRRAANTVWDSTLVKRGRDQVGEYASGIQESLQETVIEAGKNFLRSLRQFNQSRTDDASSSKTAPSDVSSAPKPKKQTKPKPEAAPSKTSTTKSQPSA